MEHQFTEILIEGKDDSSFLLCDREQFSIVRAHVGLGSVRNFVPLRTEPSYHLGWEIFVRKETVHQEPVRAGGSR